MAVEEQEELQGLLSKPSDRRMAHPVQIASNEVATPAPTRQTSSTDFSQWMVCANETFRPSGKTVEKLEPAVYAIEQDDRGLYFQRKPLVTDALIELDD